MTSKPGDARPFAVMATGALLTLWATDAPARDPAFVHATSIGTAEFFRIPVPVPVPQLARRPGAPPLDPAELQAWREERADFLARARMAALPAPEPAPGVVLDVSITPPVPRVAERPLGPHFIMPFEAGRVTSMFNRGRVHPAIDLGGPMGVPVLSTTNGQTVIFAGPYGGYGLTVRTRDGRGREHLYAHLSAIQARVGVTLAQGQRLGALGSTGFSTGPHVHYEVKDTSGRHIDPATLLFPGRTVSVGHAWTTTGLRTPSLAARD